MFLRLTNAKTGRVSLYNLMHVDEISTDMVDGSTILWSTKPGITCWRVKESIEQIERFFIEIEAMKQ